jgi:hypothetical protein
VQELRWQNFQRHVTFETRVKSVVDGGHTAPSQFPVDFITTKFSGLWLSPNGCYGVTTTGMLPNGKLRRTVVGRGEAVIW